MEISLKTRKLPTTETESAEMRLLREVEIKEAPSRDTSTMKIEVKEEPKPAVTMVIATPEKPTEEGSGMMTKVS